MIQRPRVPPAYRLAALACDVDLESEARRRAVEGADDGTLLWLARDDRLDCAVILHPDEPLERAVPVTYVAMLGLNDALGVFVPPMTEVTFAWPNRIEANGADVAAVGIELPKGAAAGSVPDWLAVFVGTNLAPPPAKGSKVAPSVTSLAEEGCHGVGPADLLEGFARHFLAWVNRWQDDGFEPVRAMWLKHAPDYGNGIEIDVGGERIAGTFAAIDDDGSLVLNQEGEGRRVELGAALLSGEGRRRPWRPAAGIAGGGDRVERNAE